MRKSLAVFLLCLVVAGAAIAQKSRKGVSHRAVVASGLPNGAAAAMHDVIDDHIRADIKFLSSDLLEGRGTGARGGDIAANYIATQFELAGLTPLGDKGTDRKSVV